MKPLTPAQQEKLNKQIAKIERELEQFRQRLPSLEPGSLLHTMTEAGIARHEAALRTLRAEQR